MIRSDKFSHLYKDFIDDKLYEENVDQKDYFSDPCDILDSKFPILIYTSYFPKFSSILEIKDDEYSCENRGILIPRFGYIMNGIVLPEGGISKIQISTMFGGFKYNMIWENRICKFHNYGDNLTYLKRVGLSSIKWVKFTSGPINYYPAGQWNNLYIKVYDNNGKIYNKLEIIFTFISGRFHNYLSESPSNFLHYYEKEKIIIAEKYNHDSTITEKKNINLKLINKLCRNRHNRKRKMLQKYLFRNVAEIVFSY